MSNKLVRYNKPSAVTSWLDSDSVFSQMDNLFRNTFESFFDDDVGTGIGLLEKSVFPKCDVVELPDKINVSVEVPGLSKEDIKVEIIENTLIVRGEKRNSTENVDKNEKWIRREIKKSSFSRQICTMNDNLDVDKIDASFKDGILSINIPKKKIDLPPVPLKIIDIK